MIEPELNGLIDEIESVNATAFWWGNTLLERASRARDPRVLQALVRRHHRLANKDAISAHVVRYAVAVSDGPEFRRVWSYIDAEGDATAITERMDDFNYLPWAAAFILGEIGGASAFLGASDRLMLAHAARHYLLVRLLSHVVVRYLQISQAAEPTGTMVDVQTGEVTRIAIPRGPSYDMELRKRTESNRYFTPLSAAAVADAKRRLQTIPDSVFNHPKPQFLHALDCLETCSV